MLCMLLGVLPVVAKDIRILKLKVMQVECENCKAKVVNQVRFEKGLKGVDVDIPSRTVVITYDADKTSVERIKASFDQIGYTGVKVISNVSAEANKQICPSAPAEKCSSEKKECSSEKKDAMSCCSSKKDADKKCSSEKKECSPEKKDAMSCCSSEKKDAMNCCSPEKKECKSEKKAEEGCCSEKKEAPVKKDCCSDKK